MERYSFENSASTRTPLSGVCDGCKADPDETGIKLKKCTGCRAVLYCSKECQTEAWPSHRAMCREQSRKSSAQLGFSSTAALANAIKRWGNIHVWALQTIVDATVHKMGGGVDDHLENQHAIVVVLTQSKPTSDPSDRNNPAKTFQIGEVCLVHKDKRDFIAAQWPRLQACCKNMENNMRAKLSEEERRAFAGFIPAAFHFDTTVSFHQYPLYRLRAHGGGPSYNYPRTEEEEKMFNEVGYLVGGLVNQGLVLRAPVGDDNAVLPEFGGYQQVKKKSWAWVHAKGWKWYEMEAYKPFAEIFRRYHPLLAHRNYDDDLFA